MVSKVSKERIGWVGVESGDSVLRGALSSEALDLGGADGAHLAPVGDEPGPIPHARPLLVHPALTQH